MHSGELQRTPPWSYLRREVVSSGRKLGSHHQGSSEAGESPTKSDGGQTGPREQGGVKVWESEEESRNLVPDDGHDPLCKRDLTHWRSLCAAA